MASAPLLYRSTLVPSPFFSNSVARPSLVVPNCTPITAPCKSAFAFNCFFASEESEPQEDRRRQTAITKVLKLNRFNLL